MMAVHLGFDAKAGMPISILLASVNWSLIFRACDNAQIDENVPLAWRIVGMVIGLVVPMFFLLLGIYAACMTIK